MDYAVEPDSILDRQIKQQPAPETGLYSRFIVIVFALSMVAAMAQRFWLADAGKRFPEHRFDQLQDPKCDFAVARNPEAQVLAEFRMKDGFPGP